MGKQDVPNARDEIRKLQEALKEKREDLRFADGSKKTPVSRTEFNDANGIKPSGDPDEQTAENFAAQKFTQANTKKLKQEQN